jgi:hypothetical protein
MLPALDTISNIILEIFDFDLRAMHARTLLPEVLASVPFLGLY